MVARLTLPSLALVLSACSPNPPPAPTQAQVQDFVKEYVAAFNEGDDARLMGLVQHDAAVSSIASGRLYRGWDAISASSGENLLAIARIAVALGPVDVTPLGPDSALAVAPMTVTAERFPQDGGGKLISTDYPGALTMIVKRTPEGLRLIHEHHSVQLQGPAKGA
jgi:ketosteroid isomerase-like protein